MTYQGMELEPADVQRVVTIIQGELGGGETVGLWPLNQRRERERERERLVQ